MFQVAQGQPDVKQVWMPINTVSSVSTLYYGQLVKFDTASMNGCAPLAVANGAADTSSKEIISGIVTGFNYYPMTNLNNATYGQYMAGVTAVADQKAIYKMGVEGMHPKGDPQPMVQVARLTPSTVIEANIYNAAMGTAPTLLTPSTAPTTSAITTNACDFTPVAQLCTTYCRTGANAGIYRISSDTSTTASTYTMYWPNTPAITDTFVRVPLRQGTSFMQINSTSGYIGMWVEASASPATNYFAISVDELDLRLSGQEKVLFRFDTCHFTAR